MAEYSDIAFHIHEGVARITINRPDRYNAFRARTCEELIDAFNKAGWDRSVGVIVLTGAGDKALCTGGDQGTHEGGYGGRGTIGLPLEELHGLMRDVPKPVIARVNGFAIGGGNVLVTVSDLAIASEKAVFGQVGPRVGSVDPGFGTAYLARVVGEKKAREIWFLRRRYSAQEALAMGMVNRVVPHAELDAEVDRWCKEILALSPTAIAIAKRACNADSGLDPRHQRFGDAGRQTVLRVRRNRRRASPPFAKNGRRTSAEARDRPLIRQGAPHPPACRDRSSIAALRHARTAARYRWTFSVGGSTAPGVAPGADGETCHSRREERLVDDLSHVSRAPVRKDVAVHGWSEPETRGYPDTSATGDVDIHRSPPGDSWVSRCETVMAGHPERLLSGVLQDVLLVVRPPLLSIVVNSDNSKIAA